MDSVLLFYGGFLVVVLVKTRVQQGFLIAKQERGKRAARILKSTARKTQKKRPESIAFGAF